MLIRCSRNVAIAGVVLGTVFAYTPAFLHEFGFHNDYALLLKDGFLSFPESKMLMMMGRFLGGLLISLESLWIHSTPDLAVTRASLWLSR